ncbi:superoxide dismutase family protein, partial [Roseisolibacter sp. H3M3-2]|uniref:superoxide dismutase family protein n=1 Tax=Roseisolibacter sp. H3M3-2 TaxID=3031323 RepID=UPI0023DC8AE4
AYAARAAAILRDAARADLGEARLVEDATGRVHLAVHVRGATPGRHGLHLHAVGACVAAGGFASAGGHYNPTAREHGHDNPLGFHAGDLPNVEVTPAGEGRLVVALGQFALAALADADGTALVLHQNEDDRRTNAGPAGPGNSGARVACGALRFE